MNATLASCKPRIPFTISKIAGPRRVCVRAKVVNTILGVRELPVAKVKVLNISKFTIPVKTKKKAALTALKMPPMRMTPVSFLQEVCVCAQESETTSMYSFM